MVDELVGPHELQSQILYVRPWNSLVGLLDGVKRASYLETMSVLPSICDLVSAPKAFVGSSSFEFFENPHSDRRTSHKGGNLILPVFLAYLD